MIQRPTAQAVRQLFTQRLRRLSWSAATVSVAALSVAMVPVSLPAQSAEVCTRHCGSNQIRFIPGQPVRIEFINRTDGTVNLERVLDIDLHWLKPQTEFAIETLVGVDDEMSLVFWDQNNSAVEARLHRPNFETLQVELLPSGHDSDRAVHISNDGKVLVY